MSSLAPPLSPPHPALSPLVLACLAATWLVWGSTYLAIKFALVSFPPFLQMGSRFLVAGALLAAWMRWVKQVPWPSARQWRHALLVGALMLGGGMGGTAYAEQSVGSGLVVAFIAVVPVMMAAGLMLWRVFPSRLEAAGIAIGLAGVLMLTRGAGFQASTSGLAAIALACLTWTAGSLLSQRRTPLAPGAMGFASEMLCGGVVLLAMAALHGEYATFARQGAPAPLALAAWLYLVVFGSLIAFNAYMLLLAKASPGLASSYCFVNPVIALLLGVWLGGETVSGYEWAAAGVVLVGVVLLLAGRRPAAA
ncbi:EamA family transporter [Methylibium sp. Pch-M]|uniref:EamA family transporter n=1 Tax=unclassified Methylibium TaxID=2633235 RepID=UPI0003F43EB7|nr:MULTISPECIES: EamA family transporter [unclassified Methylibium]EWS53094.1 putative inner membrane transporter YedA [Methylibium sp. T29]QAZ38003.1 EamA family transporter [Methylibium sp. Pch-M]